MSASEKESPSGDPKGKLLDDSSELYRSFHLMRWWNLEAVAFMVRVRKLPISAVDLNGDEIESFWAKRCTDLMISGDKNISCSCNLNFDMFQGRDQCSYVQCSTDVKRRKRISLSLTRLSAPLLRYFSDVGVHMKQGIEQSFCSTFLFIAFALLLLRRLHGIDTNIDN